MYGVSSGGALVLEAAAAGLAIDNLAVYEVPYQLGDDVPERQRHYVGTLEALLAEGRRGDALSLFMRIAGASEEDTASARSSPYWPALEGVAHTLVYDAACLGDGRPPTARLAAITQPALVATGGVIDPQMAGLESGFFDQAADAVVAGIPHAQRLTLPGQSHRVDPKVLAPALERFFAER